MKTKHIILLMATAFMMIGCAFDDPMEKKPWAETDSDQPKPVNFSVSTAYSLDFTRAAESIVTFDENEKIHVLVKPDGDTAYAGYDYTTENSGQSTALVAPDPQPYFPAGFNTTVDAYAYYPYTAGNEVTFSVRDNQSDKVDYKASDLMMAENRTITKDANDGKNNLTMKHLMAQLRVKALPDSNAVLDIKRIVVEAKKSVTFTPEGEEVTVTTGDIGTILVREGEGEGYILIPPQLINGVTIKVITGNGGDSETAVYGFTAEGEFKAGGSYGVDITVTADQLGFTTAIANWNGLGSVIIAPSGDLVIEPIPAQSYDNGNPIKPDVIVRKGTKILTLGTDYEVQYLNNFGAGTAYVVVMGKEGTQYANSVGVAPFTIKQDWASISFGSTKEVAKTYGVDEPFTIEVNNGGDGKVTYESSNPAVATVDATTGEVTLVKPGTTTITATVKNGANYIYEESASTASYTLTVNHGPGSISFAKANPTQTWSATVNENYYTQSVTHTGNGTVTYTLSENTCGATNDGSTVNYTKAGSVVVTATVQDNEYYTYETKSVSYTLTVDRAKGFVTLSSVSGSVEYNSESTFTISQTHGGEVSVSSADPTIATATVSSGTVTIAGKKVGVTKITVTSAKTDTYQEAKADYTVSVGSAMAEVTPPTVRSGLTYNGSPQALLENIGSATGGTMYYSYKLSTGSWSSWSTTAPSVTDAGTYNLKYKVEGDGNHTGISETTLNNVVIEKYQPTGQWSNTTTSVDYNSNFARTYTITGVNGTTLTTTYSSNTNSVATVSSTGVVTGAGAGTATITASFAGDTNYLPLSASYTVTVNKIANTLTLSATSGSVNYGSTSTFTVSKNASGGTLSVSSNLTSVCTASISGTTVTLTGVKAGTATITVTSAAKGSYNSAQATYSVTVNKISPTVTAPTAKSLTFNGSEQDLVNAGSTTGGTLQYSLDGTTYSTTIPRGTNANTYTVYYRVVNSTNYSDVAAKTVSVTIAKAANTLTLSSSSGSVMAGNSATITVNTNTSGGTLTASASSGDTGRVGSITKSGSTFTVPTNGVAAGSVTISVTSAATTNYKAATATYTLTITATDPGVTLANSSVGNKVGSNGLAYKSSDKIPSGVTILGVVAYKSGSSGIVVALYDAGGSTSSSGTEFTSYSAATKSVNSFSKVTGYTWIIGTKAQYQNALYGGGTSSWSTGNNNITGAGGKALTGEYWTSTDVGSSNKHTFNNSNWYTDVSTSGSSIKPRARPIIAF